VRIDALDSRTVTTEDGQLISQSTTGYFSTLPSHVIEGEPNDLTAVCAELSGKSEQFSARGSGYSIEAITDFTIIISKYTPLGGSSYFPTPRWLTKKKCIVNVRNKDQKCFAWSVLAQLYPGNGQHRNRVAKYSHYINTLDLSGLDFPLPVKQVKIFERNNPQISVNVLALSEKKNQYHILYRSDVAHVRKHCANLLLLQNVNGSHHYTLITRTSELVHGRRNAANRKAFVCNSCLHPFSSEFLLNRHLPNCMRHAPQQVFYPNPLVDSEKILKFREYGHCFELPFYIVADFECLLVDSQPSTSTTDVGISAGLNQHVISGFCCFRVCKYDKYKTEPTVYSGRDAAEKFFAHVFKESRELSIIMASNVEMKELTREQQQTHDAARICYYCEQPFTEKNCKCRHHDHISGDYIAPACQICNLALKIRKTKCHRNPKKPK
jgi:hypothetical protein